MNSAIPLFFLSYLVGSVPFGLLISRARGVDIRKVGSGNIGATNVFRMVGKPWGLLCFVLDFVKGLGAALWLPGLVSGAAFLENAGLVAGAAAIVGHNWPLWLGFKGGKGIATSGGVLAAVAPDVLLSGMGVWLLSMVATRYVSVSSILAALTVGGSGWIFHGENPVLAGVLSALGLLAIARHHSNIRRLLRGEEHRFGKPKKSDGAAPPLPKDAM